MIFNNICVKRDFYTDDYDDFLTSYYGIPDIFELSVQQKTHDVHKVDRRNQNVKYRLHY